MPGSPLKIALFQETRADEGIYLPLICALQADDHFWLKVIHNSYQWWLEKPRSYLADDPTPDWLIVLGDRRPMLEATIKAAYAGIPVAHIQGGDRSGTIDEPARHAITRFANLHFPCTQQSANRLTRMGEEPWRIQVVGPLGIYAMRDAPLLSQAEICAKLGLQDGREIILVLQHPVSTQVKQAGQQMQATLNAVKGWQTVVIYPNSDPGSEAMVRAIEACPWIHKFKNLPYLQFISLLKASVVVVGNSSTGLYEAPLFGVPGIDIGNRQRDRERPISTIHVPHVAEAIREAIRASAPIRWSQIGNPFDNAIDGPAVIMETLSQAPITERLLQKRLAW